MLSRMKRFRTCPHRPAPCRQNLSLRQVNRVMRVRSAQGGAATDAASKAAADSVKGIRLLMQELRGLDFPEREVLFYFQNATRPPKGFADYDVARASEALKKVVTGEEAEVLDAKDLEVLKAMMSDLWRWRRRGSDSWDDEVTASELALRHLQGVQDPSQSNKVSSVLLDKLEMSDADKAEIGTAAGGMVMAYINSFVWGSLVLAVLFLVFFNFLRSA